MAVSSDPCAEVVRGAREAASITRETADDKLLALLDRPVTGGKTVRDLTDSIGRGGAK